MAFNFSYFSIFLQPSTTKSFYNDYVKAESKCTENSYPHQYSYYNFRNFAICCFPDKCWLKFRTLLLLFFCLKQTFIHWRLRMSMWQFFFWHKPPQFTISFSSIISKNIQSITKQRRQFFSILYSHDRVNSTYEDN